MKTSLLFCLLSCVFSPPLLAYAHMQTLPWLLPMLTADANRWETATVDAQPELFDCGVEQGQEYCSDPIKYYKTQVTSRLWIEEGGVNRVELIAPFSPLSYSELQLNLRKDGFVLAWLKIADKHIDVIAELQQKPLYKVQREVVMFMNIGTITSPRTLIWYPKEDYYASKHSRYVKFLSDGKRVSVLFVNGKAHSVND